VGRPDTPNHAAPSAQSSQHRLVGGARVVRLEARRIQRGLADEGAQDVGARDVEVVAEVRGEEPLVKSRERGVALELGALGRG
jgi:hypothetical protein